MIGIYKITSPTGRVYIGQSWVIEQRIRYYAGSIQPKQPKLYSSIKKYEWNAHRFEIIHELPFDATQYDMDNLEGLYMSQYKECGVQMLNVRQAGSRGKHSEESIAKMKGKLGLWMIGRKIAPETIAKTTSKIKGMKRSIESKCRYRLSRLGDKNPMFGKKPHNRILSDEQVNEIRSMLIAIKYGHCAKLAKIYGVSRVTISGILSIKSKRAKLC
jgi:group I intron endonuclease